MPGFQLHKFNDESDQRPPLSGLLVLDLSRVLAGPYATMMLADLGAKVIKVERPVSGDDTRQWGPPWAGGESAYFLAVNRNKQSITLNLKHTTGREIVRELARQADVLVENWRVGTMESWNLGYEELSHSNPGLVHCAITGYGQTGPYHKQPGYDFTIQAEGGLMSITGQAEGPPMKVGVAIVDLTAGMFAAIAILAALHERTHSGKGQFLDLALLDSQIAWLANVGSNYLISGKCPERIGNAHPNIVPYEPFETSDGWLAVGIGNDKQWQALCRLAGWSDLGKDERYQTNPKRVSNREILGPVLAERFKRRSTASWRSDLVRGGIPCAPINSIDQVFSHPQVLARQMVEELVHPSAGRIKVVGSPFKLSRTPVQLNDPPPVLGQHTDAVLSEYLGYSESDLERLRKEGIV